MPKGTPWKWSCLPCEGGTSVLLPLLQKLGFRFWRHVAGDVKREDGFELGYGRTAFDGLLAHRACMVATQQILPDVTADVLIFQGRILKLSRLISEQEKYIEKLQNQLNANHSNSTR